MNRFDSQSAREVERKLLRNLAELGLADLFWEAFGIALKCLSHEGEFVSVSVPLPDSDGFLKMTFLHFHNTLPPTRPLYLCSYERIEKRIEKKHREMSYQEATHILKAYLGSRYWDEPDKFFEDYYTEEELGQALRMMSLDRLKIVLGRWHTYKAVNGEHTLCLQEARMQKGEHTLCLQEARMEAHEK